MKIICFFVCAFLLTGCLHVEPVVENYPPSWYGKEELFSHNSYELLGFGEGVSLAEANANAKESIAQNLMSRVDSSFTTIANNEMSKSESKLNITSQLDLQDLKTLKEEKIGGHFYVVLCYENLDFTQRVKKRLNIPTCKDEQTSSYMQNTLLFKKLRESLGCRLDFKLHRQNKAWYLHYKDHLFLLDKSQLEELYVTVPSKLFGFYASKDLLYDTESFYFTLSSKDDGYITLFDIYENGRVTLLQKSIKLISKMTIPSQESKNMFEAGLLESGTQTHDLYVAFFTKEPLDVSRFEYATEELASNEDSYKFDELIELMDNFAFSTLLLRTMPKR